MRSRFLAVLPLAAALTIAPDTATRSHAGQRAAPECSGWQECRQLALDARASGEYERFHDLAWRTVQAGPPNDPALMYLLARAQSLSGRPGDALVMLKRLADKGFVSDAGTDEDLARARQLPGWADLAALMDRTASGTGAAVAEPPADRAPAPIAAAPAPPPPDPAPPTRPAVRNALRFEPRPAEEVARFSTEPFVTGGLAYDAVSRRFLFGDVLGRRVMVLGEGLDKTVDLVRAAGAQFRDVTAFTIDVKRGDLWVASTAKDGDGGAIHKLQLISGRALAMIESPPTFETVRLIDLAIAASGTLFVLDGAAPRVIGLRPGSNTLDQLMSLDVAAPASIALGDDERTAYVAHRDGIARLDLQQRMAVPVTAPDGIALGGFESIRWHRNALVGVQRLADGSRHVVQLRLNRGRVTDALVITASLNGVAGSTFATVSGDDVYYLVAQEEDSATGTRVMNVVVTRVRLP